MVNINWCAKQKKGIKIIEPNEDVAKEYIQSTGNTNISKKSR